MISLFCLSFAALGAPVLAREGMHQDYTLEKVVIFSRHNLRSPMSTDNEKRNALTPHHWQKGEGNPGDLSKRGGILETMMGQSMKDYFKEEHFDIFREPVRFYSDSDERTIATARFFATGLAPTKDISIIHRKEGEKDPAYGTALPADMSASAVSELQSREETWTKDFLHTHEKELRRDFKEMERVLDISRSPAAISGEFKGFDPYDCRVHMEAGKKPKMTGSIKTAHSLSDSLLIRYYETENDKEAAFGHNLSFSDWAKIGDLKDDFGLILYGMPGAARLMASPLLQLIHREIMDPASPFTYICGHDSNVSVILASLGTKPYSLPGSLEKRVPFGVKILIEKWKGEDAKDYGTVTLLYYTAEQMRHLHVPGMHNRLTFFPLHFEGIGENEDGMMKWEEVEKMFRRA